MTPAAKAFSDALGEGSRVILRLLLITNLATALGLIVLALLRTHKLLTQRHEFASALQLEKERRRSPCNPLATVSSLPTWTAPSPT